MATTKQKLKGTAVARRKPSSLSHGRPPILSSKSGRTLLQGTLSSRVTRTTIRSHHHLQKSLTQAIATGDAELAQSLTKQLDASGGLQAYQAASLTGQSRERGGDTSKILLKWLDDGWPTWKQRKEKWRMLDVGALSTDTAAGRCGGFEIERIDLHSQGQGILEQDFMKRPLPSTDLAEGNKGDAQRFDIICLSLVVNYVPDAKQRAAMLQRVREFLVLGAMGEDSPFPALFLVLPAPCITNSRYLDAGRLRDIMESLGYGMLKMKVSAKLVYYLWSWNGERPTKIRFGKKEIVKGRTRNNFAIVVE